MTDRRCSKPACGKVAVSSMSYDYANRTVYVGQLLEERHPSYYDLCRNHLDAMVPPRGWTLRREPVGAAQLSTDATWARPLQIVRDDDRSAQSPN